MIKIEYQRIAKEYSQEQFYLLMLWQKQRVKLDHLFFGWEIWYEDREIMKYCLEGGVLHQY